MKILLLLSALVFNFAFANSSWGQAEKAAARDCNAFGFKLLAESRKTLPAANIFQSPVGLGFALAMVENGARGETLKEMARTLQPQGLAAADWNDANQLLLNHLTSLDPRIKLEIANGIWIREGASIKPDFIAGAKKFYRAEVANADFTAPGTVKNINAWVDQNTHGKIPEMVAAPLEADLRLIILDAIYFKGDWESPFNKNLTRDLPFTLPGGEKVQSARMARDGRFRYYENPEFQAVALPYTSGQASLYVFLPRENLDRFLQNLTLENWERWLAQFSLQQGSLQLPRFKLEASYDLGAELKTMGMPRAFTAQADFSGVSEERLAISWVRQKTFVEVNETGTEAAAVSGVGMRPLAIARPVAPSFTMIVDRPFYAAIVENQTGAILFHGAIMDPR